MSASTTNSGPQAIENCKGEKLDFLARLTSPVSVGSVAQPLPLAVVQILDRFDVLAREVGQQPLDVVGGVASAVPATSPAAPPHRREVRPTASENDVPSVIALRQHLSMVKSLCTNDLRSIEATDAMEVTNRKISTEFRHLGTFDAATEKSAAGRAVVAHPRRFMTAAVCQLAEVRGRNGNLLGGMGRRHPPHGRRGSPERRPRPARRSILGTSPGRPFEPSVSAQQSSAGAVQRLGPCNGDDADDQIKSGFQDPLPHVTPSVGARPRRWKWSFGPAANAEGSGY